MHCEREDSERETNRHKSTGRKPEWCGTEEREDQCTAPAALEEGLQRGRVGARLERLAAKTFQIQLSETLQSWSAYLTLTEHSIQPQQKHATFKVEYLAKIDLFRDREQFSNILKFNSCNAYSLITVELNLNPIQERFLKPQIIEN